MVMFFKKNANLFYTLEYLRKLILLELLHEKSMKKLFSALY